MSPSDLYILGQVVPGWRSAGILPAARRAITTGRAIKRGRFYDVAELLSHHRLGAMLGFFSRKHPDTDPFAVMRSLAWFEEAEEEPDPAPLLGQTWESVKRRITDAVAEL